MTGSRTPPRDIRLGQRWTASQRAKNDVLYALAVLALAVVRPLPLPWLRLLGRALGLTALGICRRARRTALENVARVFPRLDGPERRAFVRRSFSTLGESLAETVALLRPSSRAAEASAVAARMPVCNEALAVVSQARREGRGVLFASAHLGAWELVAASLVAAGIPLVTMARESYDPRFSRLYERLRGAHGVRVVWRSGAGAATRIVRSLRDGSVLGVPMDLAMRVPSCTVAFLGSDAPTPIGPARLALRTGSAVLVGSIAPPCEPARGPRGPVHVTVTRIETHDLPRGICGARELAARINREISRRILAVPHAWVWMHERWPSGTGL